MPGTLVNGFVGGRLSQILEILNLKQVLTYETLDNSTEEQEVTEVKILISYLPKD